MNRLSQSVFVAATVTVGSVCVMAADYNVAPSDLATGKPTFSAPHGTGSNPFGYDWDSAAPTVENGAPTGYGSNSFYASVESTGATQADRYIALRISPNDLFGESVSISELTGISYQTNKDAAQTTHDWWVTIYTTATGSGDDASWYKSRLQIHPEQSTSLNAPANQWNLWSTDNTTNGLDAWYDSNKSLTGMTWADILAGNTTHDYSDEEIMMIDIKLGWNSGGNPTAASYLDAVVLEFNDGTQSANINLVPEPASLALLGLGGVSLLARRRR